MSALFLKRWISKKTVLPDKNSGCSESKGYVSKLLGDINDVCIGDR